MNFETALEALKSGSTIRRQDWTERNLSVRIEVRQQTASVRLMFDGFNMPWTPTAADLLAEDWLIDDADQAEPVLDSEG